VYDFLLTKIKLFLKYIAKKLIDLIDLDFGLKKNVLKPALLIFLLVKII